MHQHYEDILKRIDRAPIWFDEFGVPRYEEFSPQRLGNIYATEAALAEVSCQQCRRVFRVALTNAFARKGFGLSDEIRLCRVHYGDPPNVRCCSAGPTMNSIMHEILEYWSRDHEVGIRWQRDPTLEGAVLNSPLAPVDAVAEALAAIQSGARALLVACTSKQNRYDLAGRITAAIASEGRVLVTCPDNYSVVARKMLDGLVPNTNVGDNANVSVSIFSKLRHTDVATFKSITILSGPNPRNESEQENWNEMAEWLARKLGDKLRIEFALPHSRRMIENPDQVVDAGRIEKARE